MRQPTPLKKGKEIDDMTTIDFVKKNIELIKGMIQKNLRQIKEGRTDLKHNKKALQHYYDILKVLEGT